MNIYLIQSYKMKKFLKIFELLLEISDKATVLRQVIKGSYLIL